jgi:Effector-associated domain 1
VPRQTSARPESFARQTQHCPSDDNKGAFHLSSDLNKLRQLEDALRDAFQPDDLNLTLSHMGHPLSDIVGPNDDFPTVVWKIVDDARRRGWLPELVGGAIKDAGGNEKLQQFIKDYPEYNPVPQPPEIKKIVGTLSKTQEMLNGELYNLKSTFETILDKIDIFKDYKVLHDELHDMSFGILPPMQREVAHLPDDENAKNILSSYDQSFQSKIKSMREAVARNKVEAEESEWIDELDTKRKALKAAIKEYDKDLVRDNLQDIATVIETQPTDINKKLLRAMLAENDRLPDLIEIMNRVCDRMKEIESEAANVPRFEKGITSLTSLTSKLKSLVKEHDTWQEVEGKLPQIGEWLEADLTKFFKKWETIRAKIKPYYSGTAEAEEWMTDFQQDDKALEEALVLGTAEGATPETIAKARATAISSFKSYYSKAKWRFFEVDKQLLSNCVTLSEIRKELP